LLVITLEQQLAGRRMNSKVEKKINGLSVSATPVFKGGLLPAYWQCIINEHVIEQTFKSAADVFRFAKNVKHH
jgi:hypothetical protein